MLDRVPRIRLERELEGQIVWLESDEEPRGLTWDRVDLSRGLLRLEKTKSGKRRGSHAAGRLRGPGDPSLPA